MVSIRMRTLRMHDTDIIVLHFPRSNHTTNTRKQYISDSHSNIIYSVAFVACLLPILVIQIYYESPVLKCNYLRIHITI